MNLAEQLRQVRQLKKDYVEAITALNNKYKDLSIGSSEFEGRCYRTIKATEHNEVYFLDPEREDYRVRYLNHVDWFYWGDMSIADAEKMAQHHGFMTEVVSLKFNVPKLFEDDDGSPTVKALKITWGA